MLCGRSVRSLDAAFRDEEDHSLLDVLPDDRQESPENLVMRGCLRGQIGTGELLLELGGAFGGAVIRRRGV